MHLLTMQKSFAPLSARTLEHTGVETNSEVRLTGSSPITVLAGNTVGRGIHRLLGAWRFWFECAVTFVLRLVLGVWRGPWHHQRLVVVCACVPLQYCPDSSMTSDWSTAAGDMRLRPLIRSPMIFRRGVSRPCTVSGMRGGASDFDFLRGS